MARIIGVIVTVLLLNVAMFIFQYSDPSHTTGENVTDISQYNSEGNSTTFWSYFTHPNTEGTTTLWSLLFSSTLGIAAVIGLGVALAGLYFTRDINMWYIGFAVTIAGFAIGTYIRFWAMVKDASILGAGSGGVVAMIIVTVILAVQLFSLIDWGRAIS